jgi:hypothetical protein
MLIGDFLPTEYPVAPAPLHNDDEKRHEKRSLPSAGMSTEFQTEFGWKAMIAKFICDKFANR